MRSKLARASEAMAFVAPQAVRTRWCQMALLRAGHRGEDSPFAPDSDTPRYRCGLLFGDGEGVAGAKRGSGTEGVPQATSQRLPPLRGVFGLACCPFGGDWRE